MGSEQPHQCPLRPHPLDGNTGHIQSMKFFFCFLFCSWIEGGREGVKGGGNGGGLEACM